MSGIRYVGFSFARCLMLATTALSMGLTSAQAQETAVNPGIQPVGIIGAASGTGGMPAVAEAVASMRNNTLYHPATMPAQKLPLLLWGEGGCRDDGLRYSQFLREIASHGFFIVAAGYPRSERPVQPPGSAPQQPPPNAAGEDGRDTEVAALLAGIDWAQQQTNDSKSPFYNRIDTAHIGVMGHSCGGLQAIAIATDPRVQTAIAFNSGVLIELPPNAAANANLVVEKAALQHLNGPIAYINGGPTDIAYKNALDDLRLIEHQPVFFAENGVGHGGTYVYDEHGGDYAQVAVAWMNWQLKGDQDSARWFRGADCKLCTRSGWAVRKKHFTGE